jgi:isoquinoline 1-oxidoreductase alpha subunit
LRFGSKRVTLESCCSIGIKIMPKYQINVNNQNYEVEAEDRMPLLWVLRDLLGLIGTKFGCGIARCGACTVHVDGKPTRSCVFPISQLSGQTVRTIEGLAEGVNLHPLQKQWIDQDVAQCGYCQAGQIMSAAALLEKKTNPTDGDIDQAMEGNYCRCGTYNRVRAAIHGAARLMNAQATSSTNEREA